MTMIKTPEGLAYFAFLQVYHGVKLQAETGMTHSRGSMIRLARERYGVRSRTAKGALAELEALKAEWGR